MSNRRKASKGGQAAPQSSAVDSYAKWPDIDAEKAVALLTGVLESNANAAVRTRAAAALGRVTGASAVRVLLRALTDRSRAVRACSLGSLRIIGDKRALSSILQILSDPTEFASVRGEAAEALAYLPSKRSIEPLICALDDPSPQVRFFAAFALGELRIVRALPKLSRVAQNDVRYVRGYGSIRAEALSAMAKIRG